MTTPTIEASDSTLGPQDLGGQGPPLMADLDASETDSALGESVAGSDYTSSLMSSVLNYTYENGRRYHAYREGNYILPNDEQEQERLDMLHHIFRMITGGPIFRAPLFENTITQRVLDIGCGTGIWTIQFADDTPEATVIGTDLSPIQPSWVPPNCKFYVDDIEGEWTYPPAEHFDYIHARNLLGSISGWRELFSKAFNHLKPGGFIEIQDFSTGVLSDDGGLRHVPYLADWIQKMCEGMLRLGKDTTPIHILKDYMREVGFVDVHEEIYKVPMGPWAKGCRYKELGLFFQAHTLDAVEPFTLALFTRALGYSAEEAHATIARVKNDVRNPNAHLYVPFFFIWGRKPE